MVDPFEKVVARAGAVLFDGALATELERRGCDVSGALWSARVLREDPRAIWQVHREYVDAGADVICSASYQASRAGFVRAGFTAADADVAIAQSVELARDAAQGRALVACSLGPYGATLADGSEYTGDYAKTVAELVAFHRPRVEAGLAAQPDLVIFETLPNLDEAQAVAQLASELGDVPFVVCFSLRGAHTISHGEPFSAAVMTFAHCRNVIAVGVNCCDAEWVAPTLSEVESHQRLMASPNSGERWNAAARAWSGSAMSQGDLLRFFGDARAAGATVFGTCCRTRPEQTATLRSQIPR